VQRTVGVDADPLAMNPTEAVAPAPSVPFHVSLVTVSVPPLLVPRPPQTWETDCPEASGQERVQPLIAPEALTVIAPWKPLFHVPVVL